VTHHPRASLAGAVRWPVPPLALIALGVLVLAAPSTLEGPVLLPVSPGHAISRLDAVGLVPLLAGIVGVYVGLWQRRARGFQLAAKSPARFASTVFAGGLGLGLLIASAFSTFFWWWAVGAVMFGVALVVAVWALARQVNEIFHRE
jgi:hypothetical protein